MRERRPAGYYAGMERTGSRGYSDHRVDREAGRIVYPVLARRSGGLSLGVDLFPDGKRCSFDCPYCEVFPFAGAPAFSPAALAAALSSFAASYSGQAGPVRDICLSGNGEPCLSPFLAEALAACAAARRDHPGVLGGARLVLITNSTGFLMPGIPALLSDHAGREGLEVWAKLDAGSNARFLAMSGSNYRFEDILSGILAFSVSTPLAIQTMLCVLDGAGPAESDLDDYALTLSRLLGCGSLVREVQLYTQARPAPMARSAALSDAALLSAAGRIASTVRPGQASRTPVFRVFGSQGELPFHHVKGGPSW